MTMMKKQFVEFRTNTIPLVVIASETSVSWCRRAIFLSHVRNGNFFSINYIGLSICIHYIDNRTLT
jgi:hypothetical protein